MKVSTSTVRIEAGPAAVWAVVTEPEHVRKWQYGSVLSTDWKVSSPIRFTSEWEGQTFEQWGTVLDFDPPSRLSYSLFAPRPDLEDRPENYFTMTYRLEPVDGGTVLTITQEDPREAGNADGTVETDNPVLVALREVAESVGHG